MTNEVQKAINLAIQLDDFPILMEVIEGIFFSFSFSILTKILNIDFQTQPKVWEVLISIYIQIKEVRLAKVVVPNPITEKQSTLI